MKFTKEIELKIVIGISALGMLLTCYLWTFVNGGHHWDLFGTTTEMFIITYGYFFMLSFSGVLLIPLFFKRDKKRWFIAFMSIPVFAFLLFSFNRFVD